MIVNILLCDEFSELLTPSVPSYVSMFERLFRSIRPDTKIKIFRAMDNELPNIDTVDGLCLIPGCSKGVYEDIPWVRHLLEWIRCANKNNVKLAGVCFGHQAIAQALGGQVEYSLKGWGIGKRESHVVDKETLKYFPNGKMSLFYNHHDQVVKLPKDAILMSTSKFCNVESFRIGNNILAFQGHPEYVSEFALNLIENHADDELLEVRQEALKSINTLKNDGKIVAQMMFDLVENNVKC